MYPHYPNGFFYPTHVGPNLDFDHNINYDPMAFLPPALPVMGRNGPMLIPFPNLMAMPFAPPMYPLPPLGEREFRPIAGQPIIEDEELPMDPPGTVFYPLPPPMMMPLPFMMPFPPPMYPMNPPMASEIVPVESEPTAEDEETLESPIDQSPKSGSKSVPVAEETVAKPTCPKALSLQEIMNEELRKHEKKLQRQTKSTEKFHQRQAEVNHRKKAALSKLAKDKVTQEIETSTVKPEDTWYTSKAVKIVIDSLKVEEPAVKPALPKPIFSRSGGLSANRTQSPKVEGEKQSANSPLVNMKLLERHKTLFQGANNRQEAIIDYPIGENLMEKTLSHAAASHGYKRMFLYTVIVEMIRAFEDPKAGEKITFSNDFMAGEDAAPCTIVDAQSVKDTQDYRARRVHISMVPRLIGDAYKTEGSVRKIEEKGRFDFGLTQWEMIIGSEPKGTAKLTSNDILNICDVADKNLNYIDDFFEHVLRAWSKDNNLTEMATKVQTPREAVEKFIVHYQHGLIFLREIFSFMINEDKECRKGKDEFKTNFASFLDEACELYLSNSGLKEVIIKTERRKIGFREYLNAYLSASGKFLKNDLPSYLEIVNGMLEGVAVYKQDFAKKPTT